MPWSTKSREYAVGMEVDERTARRHLNHFVKLNLVRKTGSGPSTDYYMNEVTAIPEQRSLFRTKIRTLCLDNGYYLLFPMPLLPDPPQSSNRVG